MLDTYNVYENYINRERYLALEVNNSFKLQLLDELEKEFKRNKEDYKKCINCGCYFNFFAISKLNFADQVTLFKNSKCGC